MKNKKLLLSLVAVVIILAVVIVLLFMRRSPSYEDYDNFGKLPGEISISEKIAQAKGFITLVLTMSRRQIMKSCLRNPVSSRSSL